MLARAQAHAAAASKARWMWSSLDVAAIAGHVQGHGWIQAQAPRLTSSTSLSVSTMMSTWTPGRLTFLVSPRDLALRHLWRGGARGRQG
jgi:hypothetical protein